jgi:hypothetical protein
MPVPAPDADWYWKLVLMSTRAGETSAATEDVLADPPDEPDPPDVPLGVWVAGVWVAGVWVVGGSCKATAGVTEAAGHSSWVSPALAATVPTASTAARTGPVRRRRRTRPA